jgi:Ran GTPase-activating protein (RanGAP) involved in mRNA processing and transport
MTIEELKKYIIGSSWNLSSRNLTDDDAKLVADYLKSDTKLTHLVKYNQIGDEGGKAIGKALEANKTLTQLYLQNNKIGDEEVEAINMLLESSGSFIKKLLDYVYKSINKNGDKLVINTQYYKSLKILKIHLKLSKKILNKKLILIFNILKSIYFNYLEFLRILNY